MSINTRIASYSAENLCKKYGVKRVSAKLMNQAIKDNNPFDLQICDMSSPDDGRYTSPAELKKRGEKSVVVRFNDDRSVTVIKL
jgi:hypothetical protein